MNNEKTHRIEEILNSLDSSRRAPAPDFFYSRLKARMQRGFERGSKRWILRPVYALAVLVLVLIVNITVMLSSKQATDNTATDNETAQTIAAEYNLNDSNSLYDLTTDK